MVPGKTPAPCAPAFSARFEIDQPGRAEAAHHRPRSHGGATAFDSYSLLQALAYLAGWPVDGYEVRVLRLRLQPAGARAQLDLGWAGTGLSTETVMNWQIDAMRSGADAAR